MYLQRRGSGSGNVIVTWIYHSYRVVDWVVDYNYIYGPNMTKTMRMDGSKFGWNEWMYGFLF